MTVLEAINQVELKLTELKLIDRFGDPIIGIEAAGILAKFHDGVWQEVENNFSDGLIDAETYATAMTMLIEEFNRHKFRREIEKQIVEIQTYQGGAA